MEAPGSAVVAVCDLREANVAPANSTQHNILTVQRSHTGSTIDAVVIATPVSVAFRLAEAFLCGKHFLEKTAGL